jgi:hypothetical protein
MTCFHCGHSGFCRACGTLEADGVARTGHMESASSARQMTSRASCARLVLTTPGLARCARVGRSRPSNCAAQGGRQPRHPHVTSRGSPPRTSDGSLKPVKGSGRQRVTSGETSHAWSHVIPSSQNHFWGVSEL